MKVYLDDTRDTPEGWARTFWPLETIHLLKTGKVTHLSLDHDLGKDNAEFEDDIEFGTGYDVLLWIEQAVVEQDFVPPDIVIHSANASVWTKMSLAIDSIYRFATKKAELAPLKDMKAEGDRLRKELDYEYEMERENRDHVRD